MSELMILGHEFAHLTLDESMSPKLTDFAIPEIHADPDTNTKWCDEFRADAIGGTLAFQAGLNSRATASSLQEVIITTGLAKENASSERFVILISRVSRSPWNGSKNRLG